MEAHKPSELFVVVATLTLIATIEARLLSGKGGRKSHYTDAHNVLHETLQKTTHSHLQDFEIAIPELVDESGHHVTHLLQRAGTSRGDPSSLVRNIKLSAHSQEFRIELTPNNMLLAPDFTIKRIRRNVASGELEEAEERNEGLDCHFRGRMLSHSNRTTAISLCSGMTGFLRTEKDDFIVEPVAHDLVHDFPVPQHPHVVYKKSQLQGGKQLHYCGKQRRHPVAVVADERVGIRHLSDGAIVVKSATEVENEYDLSSSDFGAMRFENRPRRDATARPAEEPNPKERRRVVETLVVADQKMIKNHESDRVDVTTYLLTVMNMVTGLFRDGTLDDQIDIVLVGLTLLEDDTDLRLDHRADKSLANFCRWQSKANTTTGRKPDHAILITGIDICIDKNEPCDTLGLAQIGGMCSISDSCTINEDMGLGLAFTVAHETGHSFGMQHDGHGNACNKKGGHIMSPTLNTIDGVYTWSSCSRRAMQQFLKTAHSRCLDDYSATTVAENLRFPEELPGQMYSADDQCKLLLGMDAQLCHFRYHDNLKAICKNLWCQRSDGVCSTKYMPAAEGTYCGEDLWCRRGVCVPHGSPGPNAVNGGWSNYGPWSECSRTCGGGVSYRERHCDSPTPRYGGRYCEGEPKIYELCNTQDCPLTALDFRSQQCAEHNSKPYRRQYFTWVPYTKYWKYDFNKCELLCEAEGNGFFDRLMPHVKDGTSCDDESNDVCIAGQCVHVGCDRVLNSNSTVDACGVCSGDNSTCRYINGAFTTNITDSGYYYVTRIPSGAYSIRVWEKACCTHSYIAIKSASDPSSYHLNGNWRVDLYGNPKFAGAKWKYERQLMQKEKLTSPGPIDEDIVVEALIIEKNAGVSFSYAVEEIDNRLPYPTVKDSNEDMTRHMYLWNVRMSSCSKSCAAGERENIVTCMEDNKLPVNDSFCDPDKKPTLQATKCNTHPCPAKWVTKEWGRCSRTCGGGIQTRRVTCKHTTSKGEVYATPNKCDLAHKPSRNQKCENVECPLEWGASKWSRCSRLCGRGVRTRTVYCKSGIRKVPYDQCDQHAKPIFRQSCLNSHCRRRYQWLIKGWEKCSVTCGNGQQRREIMCTFKDRTGKHKPVNYRKCRRARKPRISLRKPCSYQVCARQEFTTEKPGTTANTMTRKHQNYVKPTVARPRQLDSRQHHRDRAHDTKWVTSTWQQCTVTCGGGNQVRAVKCMRVGKPSTSCSYNKKPSHTRVCNTVQCSNNIVENVGNVCVDRFRWCHLVPQHNTCYHKYFGKQCCRSCINSARRSLS